MQVNSINYHYDKEADVFYVNLKDDEPTYTKNIDDFIMLEIGWFSGLLRGFCLLGLKEMIICR